MRVLILNQPFYPDVAATAQHAHDLGRYLVERGHEVDVVASRSIYGETGASLPARERVDGIDVHRVGMSVFGKKGIAARLADFLLFYDLAALKVLTLPRADVVVTLTTPPFIGLVGATLRLLRGSRWVYWGMDLYPDVPVALGVMKPDGWLTLGFEWLNRWLMRACDRTVALGRCMKRLIVSKGVSAENVEVIGVWAANEPARRDPAASSYRGAWGLDGRFVVMYSGNLGLAHDAETLIAAAERLRDREDIRFVFVGSGKRMAEIRERVEALPNAQIYGYQPRERLEDLLSMADVHLISQLPSFTGVVVPSKLYGIMAAGRPSLFVGPEDAEVALELAESGAGLRIDVGDVDGLVSGIESLAGDREGCRAMGDRALAATRSRHAVEHRCAAWERLLVEVVQTSRYTDDAV
ncbi:glycosyltransferase family 4 protein [Mucisphaera calidilacus]|uniref:Putative glycosyl transferase n=1 Tax=Mucisphaera calidilacus TaxID=2527982 RepID=A0A518C0I4_9BACT|nr:glycosyltransferase family 4 protein [Mucisphaera calidilacus]QDU72717.1 putative glycosyl transferase [Mucisphaera calidilacus]